MPETVEDLETQLDQLRSARAAGTKSYSIGNRSLERRSDQEMASAIADIERRLTIMKGESPTGVVYIASSKGT